MNESCHIWMWHWLSTWRLRHTGHLVHGLHVGAYRHVYAYRHVCAYGHVYGYGVATLRALHLYAYWRAASSNRAAKHMRIGSRALGGTLMCVAWLVHTWYRVSQSWRDRHTHCIIATHSLYTHIHDMRRAYSLTHIIRSAHSLHTHIIRSAHSLTHAAHMSISHIEIESRSICTHDMGWLTKHIIFTVTDHMHVSCIDIESHELCAHMMCTR